MIATIDADELASLREELKRLTDRETELLEKNSELRFELQSMRSISVFMRDLEKHLAEGLEQCITECAKGRP
jgi:hypothetical protein